MNWSTNPLFCQCCQGQCCRIRQQNRCSKRDTGNGADELGGWYNVWWYVWNLLAFDQHLIFKSCSRIRSSLWEDLYNSHSRKWLPHSRTVSEVSKPESIISFNEHVYLAMQNADTSTLTYVERAHVITGNLEAEVGRWINTPPSLNNVDTEKVLDAMITHARGTGAKAPSIIPAVLSAHVQRSTNKSTLQTHGSCICYTHVSDKLEVKFWSKHWSIQLIVTAGYHQPLDRISEQAMPTTDDTMGSLVSANMERRSGFRNDMRSSSRVVAKWYSNRRVVRMEHVPPGMD